MAEEQAEQQANSLRLTEQEQDFLKIIYKEMSERSRYYDAHVWQIPSVTVAVNAFLVGQAFAEGLQGATIARALVVFSATFFTFVLLIALVKHRLHQRAQDQNILRIEETFMNEKADIFHPTYNFSNVDHIRNVEQIPQNEKPGLIVRKLGSMRAHQWLINVMSITVITDIVIFTGIILYWW